MTNNNPVVFDPQNQWAEELGASFIGSMAVIYFRDHLYSPRLDYLEREDAIQNCKDYCGLMRSMGYVAFIGYSSDDNEPQTVIVCNVPIDVLFSTCTVFNGYVISYHTPCNKSVKVVSWLLSLKTVPNEPLQQKSYEHLKTQYEYKDWDIDDFLSLSRDLSQCTIRGNSFSINDVAVLSARIKDVVQQHWLEKDEDALKSLYAEALNNVRSPRDELRRSLSKPINDLIDEGLIDPDPRTGENEEDTEDLKLMACFARWTFNVNASEAAPQTG